MLTTTMSNFRKDIKKYFDSVTQDYETLIINRGDDTAVVIISLEEYNALTATQHELSSVTNGQRLDAAIGKLKEGRGFARKLKDA